jgi:hypothetical protein
MKEKSKTCIIGKGKLELYTPNVYDVTFMIYGSENHMKNRPDEGYMSEFKVLATSLNALENLFRKRAITEGCDILHSKEPDGRGGGCCTFTGKHGRYVVFTFDREIEVDDIAINGELLE